MRNKFNIWRQTNSVLILRNGVVELDIHTKDPTKLEKYLRTLLPRDYTEYLHTFDIDHSVHTCEWWTNLLKNDEDIRDMFTRSIPRRLTLQKEIVV